MFYESKEDLTDEYVNLKTVNGTLQYELRLSIYLLALPLWLSKTSIWLHYHLKLCIHDFHVGLWDIGNTAQS